VGEGVVVAGDHGVGGRPHDDRPVPLGSTAEEQALAEQLVEHTRPLVVEDERALHSPPIRHHDRDRCSA